MIIVIMLSSLVTILFYSKVIFDPQNLKELIIVTIIYSLSLLTLISNSNINISEPIVNNTKFRIWILIIGIFTTIITGGVFYLTKNINKIAAEVREKQIIRQNEIAKNPLIFPGHLAHIEVKKYYLQNSHEEEISYQKNLQISKIIELYSDNYKQKLRDNILFKRLSEAIIIMAGAITILSLSYHYSFKEQK